MESGKLTLNNGITFEKLISQIQGQADEGLKKWTAEQVKTETEKLKAQGARVIPMAVKNCSQILQVDESGKIQVLNRMELDTGFNFDKIQQIALSDSIPVPQKPGFSYVNVLLFTDKPIPLLVPYVYLEQINKDKLEPESTESLKNVEQNSEKSSIGQPQSQTTLSKSKSPSEKSQSTMGNPLDTWVLVNNGGHATTHKVAQYNVIND